MTWFFEEVDVLKEFRQFAFSYLLQKALKLSTFANFFLTFFLVFFSVFFFFFFWETAESITAFKWNNHYFLDNFKPSKPYELGKLLARASLNDIDDDQISCGSWNSISYLPTFFLL